MLCGSRDVKPIPPSGDPRFHSRPSVQLSNGAQGVLPRLQIVDPPYPKAPLRRHHIPHRGGPASWKRMFPDPSTSPAHFTKALIIRSLRVVTTTDAEEGGWIRGFSRVVQLEVGEDRQTYVDESEVSLLPFHGLSPVVKHLRLRFVVLPSSRISDLILSFPLLEDLAVVAEKGTIDNGDESNAPPTTVHPSGPTLTGSLQLNLKGGMEPIVRRLLSLPGGINFRELSFPWYHERDPSMTMALVEKCSRTIETLDIICYNCTSIRCRCPLDFAL